MFTIKRFFAGFLLGVLLTLSVTGFAAENIHLLVDGREVLSPDAPPQIINGRVMVPARPLAEALGAKVEWDQIKRAVVVSTLLGASTINQGTTTLTKGDSFQTRDGLEVSLLDFYYTTSFSFEFLGELVRGGVVTPEPGKKLFVFSVEINNPTSAYKQADRNTVGNLFKLQPQQVDGREWYVSLYDIDYNKLNERRYLPGGSKVKANLIWYLPDDVGVAKIILPKYRTTSTTDLEIDVSQP